MKPLYLLAIAILLMVIFWDLIITLLYSHLGRGQSTSEDDNRHGAKRGLIDHLYHNTNNWHSRSLRNYPRQTAQLMPEIDVSQLTRDKFIELTNNFSTPLIVRRFLSGTAATRKWSLNYFKKHYGKLKLPIIQNGDIDNHAKYVRHHQANYTTLTLGQLIDSIKRGGKHYLNNVSRIFGVYPQLLDDMELERIERYTGIDVKHSNNVTHMFMGGKKTGSSLHCSITGNFFYNIKGQKKWVLIHPKYSRHLLPNISRTGLFVVSHFDILKDNPNSVVFNIPRYEMVLNEGDLFFNPPWWWHAVENVTPYTIACANRFSNFWIGLRNNPLFSLVFFSHPISNWQDFNFASKQESNLKFDQSLLKDILRKKRKVL